MDILLGGGSNSELGKLLSGKNAGLLMTLLPFVLQLLGSKQSSPTRDTTKSKTKGKTKSKTKSRTRSKTGGQSGLDDIIGGLTSGGLGDIVGSWIGGGPNKAISPAQVKKGLGASTVKQIAAESGLPEADVAEGLAQLLPVVVNQVTPQAEVPPPNSLDSALADLAGLLSRS